jgi:hypothetical protein
MTTNEKIAAIRDAKQKLISQQVELRQLESKKQDIQAQIDGTVDKITG